MLACAFKILLLLGQGITEVNPFIKVKTKPSRQIYQLQFERVLLIHMLNRSNERQN